MTKPNKYYIRFRGIITGPLEYETILQQVRIGQITRLHEFSTDGRNFQPAAGACPEIFAPASPSAPPPVPVGDIKVSETVENDPAHEEYMALMKEESEIEVQRVATAPGYLAAGFVLLVAAILPRADEAGNAVWFLSEFSGDNMRIGIGGVIGILSALCAFVFSCISAGVTRGVIFMLLGIVGCLLTGICAAMTAGGEFLFVVAVAITLSGATIGASLVSFACGAYKPLGITSCIFTVIAAVLAGVAISGCGEDGFTTSQLAGIILLAGGAVMMFMSSAAAISAGEVVTPPLPDGEFIAPEHLLVRHRKSTVKNICIAAGFGSVGWLLIAMACFFVMPVEPHNDATAGGLVLLRAVMAWICFGIFIGGAICDMTCNQQGDIENVQ